MFYAILRLAYNLRAHADRGLQVLLRRQHVHKMGELLQRNRVKHAHATAQQVEQPEDEVGLPQIDRQPSAVPCHEHDQIHDGSHRALPQCRVRLPWLPHWQLLALQRRVQRVFQ